MNDSILISIIVPVYKVEKYIDKCIESIVEQKYKDIEIILVDDGSPDKCGEICETWMMKDKRIKVYHKANGGQAEARNYGICNAHGEYLFFLDSDDYLFSSDSILNIVESIRNCNKPDVVMCNFIKKNCNDGKERVFFNDNMDCKIDNKLELIAQNIFHVAPWSKCCKTEFIFNNDIYFPKKKHEDLLWSTDVLLGMKTYAVCKTPILVYCTKRNGSTSNSIMVKNLKDIDDQFEIVKNRLQDEKRNLAYAFWAQQFCWIFSYYDRYEKPIKDVVKANMDKFNIMKYGVDNRSKIFTMVSKCIGYTNAVRILILFQKIRERVL